MNGTIYIRDYQTLQHMKYRNSGRFIFREEEFFLVFPIVNLWTPGAWPNLIPGALLAKLLAGHCHIPNIKAMGLVISEKKSFDFSSIKTYMLPWQPEFQPDLPKNNMQPFPLPSDAVRVI